jgi:predicted nuclease with TOPRIM domain
MPIDIVTALQSAASIMSVVKNVLDELTNKKQMKLSEIDALKGEIKTILDRLDKIGSMGVLLDDYIKYYSGFYALYTTSDKLNEQINRYRTELEGGDILRWEIVESSMKDLREMKSNYINILLGRKDYLDAKDSAQIIIKTQFLDGQYNQAQAFLASKNCAELKRCMGSIADTSLDLYKMIESSLDGMTDSLKRLREN